MFKPLITPKTLQLKCLVLQRRGRNEELLDIFNIICLHGQARPSTIYLRLRMTETKSQMKLSVSQMCKDQ